MTQWCHSLFAILGQKGENLELMFQILIDMRAEARKGGIR